MPLAIYSLGGGHKHPCIHIHMKVISRNQVHASATSVRLVKKIGAFIHSVTIFSQNDASHLTIYRIYLYKSQDHINVWEPGKQLIKLLV